MARNATPDEPKLVVLVDPNGNEYRSNSPAEINRLHYGQSYTFRDHATWAEALASLGDDVAHMPVPSHPAPKPVETVQTADDVVVETNSGETPTTE